MNTTPDARAEAASLHPSLARTADYSGRSNLALAFLCLPRDKRKDMNVFYMFCRVVDDIADSPELTPVEKTDLLGAWRSVIRIPAQSEPGVSTLAHDLNALVGKYHLPPEHLLEIIAGVEMDLTGRQYPTFEQLRTYCYRVASVVGLVSIEIFGYQDSETQRYAVDLGMALQLTNIIRDVNADLENGGRIYLPLEDLERFGYTTADLRARVYDKRFQALMTFEANRAEGYYQSAVSHLRSVDRLTMLASEIMRAIYWRLLLKLQRGRYQVCGRRFRLRTPRKLTILAVSVIRNRWMAG